MSSLIPDSAPFSEEQRAWLNGFFSGLMGIRSDLSPGAALEAAGIATEQIVVHRSKQKIFPGTILRCRSSIEWNSPKANPSNAD